MELESLYHKDGNKIITVMDQKSTERQTENIRKKHLVYKWQHLKIQRDHYNQVSWNL
uniref:Uncharacterized protein n=1 Tax=Rhizophora mucronata TaxID=61149 RepID=A0A2P2PKB7_RHIMU